MTSEAETFGFDADIQQLLRLIINAFYSDKSVFLRELLSNASDALDKARLQGLTSPSAHGAARDLQINIVPDKASRTLTIEDTGVGMTRDDLVKNLGTVARSGTRAFMEAVTKGGDAKLIGQFGVGFYSSFLVADTVVVSSKSNDDARHVWSSTADGSFTVAPETNNVAPITRGTRVVLHLKEGMDEYLEEHTLRSLVGRHCGFVAYPIELLTTKTVDAEIDTSADKSASVPAQEGDAQSLGPNKDGSDAKKEKKEVKEFERVNGVQPVWTKSPSNVTEEEYKEFYKAISNDWDDYAVKRHFVGEGTVEFQALLYVPKHPPFDMLMGVAKQDAKQRNVKLYARRILILDEFDEFLPSYLGFVKGVVNCDDIPLNVSRELLQDNKMLKFIAKNLVKRCLEMFAELASDQDAYKVFYGAFSTSLKLGVHEDTANREKLVDLLRFPSNKTLAEDAQKPSEPTDAKKDPMSALMGPTNQGSFVSLKDYVARMAKDQEEIYVLTGESVKTIDSSPFMEKIREQSLEVLYLAEPIDEYVLGALGQTPIHGKRLVNISKQGARLPGASTESESSDKDTNAETKDQEDVRCALMQKLLGAKVEKVELSDQLVQSPCALSVPQQGYSANMERIMRAQALQSQEQRMMMPAMTRRTLLLNPRHRLIEWLKSQAEQQGLEDAAKDERVCETVQILFDTALMSSGFSLEEPAAVASRVQNLLLSKL